MKKSRITGSGAVALAASLIAGIMPGTATQAAPSQANAPQAKQSTAKTERAALPISQSARAAAGVQTLSGGYNPRLWLSAGTPWGAPRYNQRKARRAARRVNRAVSR